MFRASYLLEEKEAPSGWTVVKVKDVASVNARSLSPINYPDVIEYIDISSVGERFMQKPTLIRYGDAPSRAKRIVSKNDILISTVRPNLRHYVYVKDQKDNLIASTGFAVVSVRPTVDPRFLYFYLTSEPFTGYLTQVADGGAYPAFNPSEIENAELLFPPLEEQQSIAEILGTLENKIDLNRLMNETLEAIARAIFKSWFIDFDPVRAKADGKQPFGMDEETAALFPSEFEDSELGEIPKGWAIGYLSNYAENPRRGIEPTEIAPETPYFGLEHMPRGSISLSDWGAAETISSNKFIFRQGEILFGKLRPYFRKVGVAPIDGVCSTDIFVLRPRRREYGEFVLMWASDQRFIDHCNAVSNGARMPRVNWKDMVSYPFVAPQDSILEKYHQIIRPMVEQIIQNIHLSRTLHELRDALLPKLLSGEIRVPMEAD